MHINPSAILCFAGLVVSCLIPPVHAADSSTPADTAKTALFDSMKSNAPPMACIKRRKFGLNGTNQIMFSRQSPPGSEILVFDPQSPTTPPRSIFSTATGFVLDIAPSYDGKTILFSLREKTGSPYHLWEIHSDGTGLRQLTSGNHHDFNPVYYPDGRIVFSSSRVEAYSLCQNYLACGLYICNADGSNIRRIDFTSLTSTTPSILPDGRILFTRWEYNDKNIFSWQGLWTIHPNGSNLKLFFGNTFVIPNGFYGAKPIPGTDEVLALMVAHHYPPFGDLLTINPAFGLEAPKGITRLTSFTPWQVTQGSGWKSAGLQMEWEPGDSYEPWSVTGAFPLSKAMSVISRGNRLSKQFEIALLDHQSKSVVPILAREDTSYFCPIPLSQRPHSNIIPGEAPREAGFGTFLVADVYQGLLEQGVKRGQVKALRIMSQVPKKYNTEGPRYHDTYPVIGAGTYYVKENFGTVPVNEDGSACFLAPSNRELYFQALDESGKEISRMGSVTQITKGEVVTCVGCHENRLTPPLVNANAKRSLQPVAITPPAWGAGPVDYVKQVQPVFDKYCVTCHSGATPAAGLDFSGDKTRFFNLSYETIIVNDLVDFHWLKNAPTGVLPALQTGSRVSKLVKVIESNHQKVNLDPESRLRIYTWIDANVPYYSTWDMTRPHSVGGRDTFSPTFISAVDEIIMRRKLAGFSFAFNTNGDLNKDFYKINLTHPEYSRLLAENLAKSGGGLAADDHAAFKTRNDPDYLAILAHIEILKIALLAKPRMDMPGAIPVPQERNFGKVFP